MKSPANELFASLYNTQIYSYKCIFLNNTNVVDISKDSLKYYCNRNCLKILIIV